MPILPWEPQNPYLIWGYLRYGGAGSENVTATNRRTGESLTEAAQAGAYMVDAANFANGYVDKDTIDIAAGGHRIVSTVNTGLFPAERRVDINPGAASPRRSSRRRRR